MNLWKVLISAALVDLLSATAFADGSTLVADFDSLPEASIGTEFIDGGIRFFELDVDLGLPEYRFVIECCDVFAPIFSPPNYLGFNGPNPGPFGNGLNRFVSMTMEVPGTATNAQLDAISSTYSNSSVLNLSAFLDGLEVATTRAIGGQGTPLGPFIEHHRLSINAVRFDSLRLFATDIDGAPSFALTAVDVVYQAN